MQYAHINNAFSCSDNNKFSRIIKIHTGCIQNGARTVTYGPILAHNLPADATNTKRLYFHGGRRGQSGVAGGGGLEGSGVCRLGLRRPSAGDTEQSS